MPAMPKGTSPGTPRSWRAVRGRPGRSARRLRCTAARALSPGLLGSYRHRAAAHGLAEDAALEDRFRAAHDVFWSALCDLTTARAGARRAVSTGGPRCGRRGRRHGAATSDRGGIWGAIVSEGHCQQPGCTGEIEDGYCNVCGTPGDAHPATCPGRQAGALRQLRHLDAVGRGDGISEKLSSTPIGPGAPAPWTTRPHPPPRRVQQPDPAPRRRHHHRPVGAASPTRSRSCSPTRRSPRTSASARTCGEPVGRSRAGQAGPRPRASARSAGTPFSFTPKLQPGDVVGGQYEVVGVHRARRPRLDLPRPRPQRVRPLRGAQGPAEHGRRRTRSRPRSPSASSSPRCSTRSSSRSTTSRPTRAPATSSWSTSAASR